ncbi:MAG: hypothetical protein H0T76_29255 [Nannocystis sp.]|nr:hypothetical protein [Nannocystis sp.]MBA3550583.1 hypothetical protein [Nannocystis sp.]
MSRSFREAITEAERIHLQGLLDADGPEVYRSTMQRLGEDLGRRVVDMLPERGMCMLVCTVEDADFLARGFLETVGVERVVLRCFWNERRKLGDFELAPIIRRYVEPGDEDVSALVVIKSIISGACVVRTNLMEVLERVKPAQIFVVAPVIHAEAERKLEQEFPSEIARSFTYVWLARDDAREPDGNVVPGIGGSVYDLLGLGGEQAKNRYYPQLIHERRALRLDRQRG